MPEALDQAGYTPTLIVLTPRRYERLRKALALKPATTADGKMLTGRTTAPRQSALRDPRSGGAGSPAA